MVLNALVDSFLPRSVKSVGLKGLTYRPGQVWVMGQSHKN